MTILKRVLSYIFMLFLSVSVLPARKVFFITVKDQKQFEDVIDRINNGEQIYINLGNGKYYLKKPIIAKVPLNIQGSNATITCAKDPRRGFLRSTDYHDIYSTKYNPHLFPLFLDRDGNILKVSESVIDSVSVNFVDGDIPVPSGYEAGSIVKIPIPHNLLHLKNKVFKRAYGYFDCGWKIVNFKIVESNDRYFVCHTLKKCTINDYQFDRNHYNKPVRFVVYNAEVKPGAIYYDDEKLYIPKNIDTISCVYLSNDDHSGIEINTYSDISIEGICFEGFSGFTVHSKMQDICVIKNCTFRNNLGLGLKIEKKNGGGSPKAIIENCSFEKCALYKDFVVSLCSGFDDHQCIEMRNCKVTRYPDNEVLYKNTSGAVYVRGDVALIGNVIFNTPRCHLYLTKGKIVVNGNLIYNSDKFYDKPARNTSSDWGLIYCNHIYKNTKDALLNKKNRILIENNLLYGASAYGGNARGVFIDDGRGDVECINNIILNTQIYSIDSRNVSFHGASSVRNKYMGNIVTSKYRLMAGNEIRKSDLPEVKRNLLPTNQKNRIANTRIIDNDIYMGNIGTVFFDKDKIKVPRELYKVIKKSPAWAFSKSYIVCSN